MNLEQFRHTFTAWGGQLTKARLKGVRLTELLHPMGSLRWYSQMWLAPNTYSSDCWIITFPQQHLTNAHLKAKTIFSTARGSCSEDRRWWRYSSGGWSRMLGGSNQRGMLVLWVCVTLVVGFGEVQRLISSQAGHCVPSAHLSEIFFWLSIIVFEHCILTLGSP